MDQQVKKLWLEALRSGEYKQGRGRLRSANSFCCLGVLCDLHSKQTGRGRWDDDHYRTELDYSRYGLSIDVSKWAELALKNPVIDRVVHMNDNGPQDFNEIAAIIEHEL